MGNKVMTNVLVAVCFRGEAKLSEREVSFFKAIIMCDTAETAKIQESDKVCSDQKPNQIQKYYQIYVAQTETSSSGCSTSAAHDESPRKNKQNHPIVRIDRARIPSVPLSQAFSGNTLEELTKLGVESFNAKEMEENVLKQVNDQLMQHKNRRLAELESSIGSLETKLEDIRMKVQTLNNELMSLQHTISQNASSDPCQIRSISQEYNAKQMALAELRILEKQISRELRRLKRKREKFAVTEADSEFERTLMDEISGPSSKKNVTVRNSESDVQKSGEEDEEKMTTNSDEREDENSVYFAGGYRLSQDIWKQLFPHQQAGVRWLWELHRQETGGIVADEMGLGKTVQVIAFLTGLVQSGLINADTPPILLVCPATLLEQWRTEFSLWGPNFRVTLLHRLGLRSPCKRQRLATSDSDSDSDSHSAANSSWDSDTNDVVSLDDVVSDSEEWKPHMPHLSNSTSCNSRKRRYSSEASVIVSSSVSEHIRCTLQRVCRPPAGKNVLMTTYESLRQHSAQLLPIVWHYAIFDEGHKLRNPNANITIFAKQLRTPHRLLITGAPIQNCLTELWSLFDFVFPGKLGTLPLFQRQFADPITRGGYVHATAFERRLALKCAMLLRDLINPYLLRRLKQDVGLQLPDKTEHVLFCRLTAVQRDLYLNFLNSKEGRAVLRGIKNPLFGIDVLRKVCNHPLLLTPHKTETVLSRECDTDLIAHSAKLQVLQQILPPWLRDGSRVLIFAQTQQMLNILERFLELEHYSYARMDGSTPLAQRQTLISTFNSPNSPFSIFLLTTRVGGLGVNLTAANKVIVFDPDWNPQIDLQARERCYRIGQQRSVTVYRLITAGTLEEKIFHRQIFKQYLTHKILKNPKLSRAFFKSLDLKELFALDDSGQTSTSPNFVLNPLATNNNNNHQLRTKEDETKDDWLLNALTQNVPLLQCALNHDTLLEDEENADDETHQHMEKQFLKQYAEEALRTLRASRKQLKDSLPLHQPTWTGKRGMESCKFGTISMGQTSSAQLLTQLQQIQHSVLTESDNRLAAIKELLNELHEFFVQRQGTVTTNVIVDHFKKRVKGFQVRLFRQLLKQIAEFDKTSKTWTLKSAQL